MAKPAVAQEAVCALREAIARIEGAPVARLTGGAMARAEHPGTDARDEDGATVLREAGRVAAAFLPTGAARFDAALGGGVPARALTEITCADTRDAGACAAFAFGLAARLAEPGRPVLAVADAMSLAEGGVFHAPALEALFGLKPGDLILAAAKRPEDALWIAEEAARLDALAAVIAEIRGDARALTLTATQRLNRRAMAAGRPVLLLRQAARAQQATAAPVRLTVASAPASPRRVFGRAVAGTIGPPAFAVTISKCRSAPPATFRLEWNSHDRHFQEGQPAHSRYRISLPADGPAAPDGARARLAANAAGGQR